MTSFPYRYILISRKGAAKGPQKGEKMTREEITNMTAAELVDEYEWWTQRAAQTSNAATFIEAVEVKAFIRSEMIERMSKKVSR